MVVVVVVVVHIGLKMKISSHKKSVILWSFLGYFETKKRVSGAGRSEGALSRGLEGPLDRPPDGRKAS